MRSTRTIGFGLGAGLVLYPAYAAFAAAAATTPASASTSPAAVSLPAIAVTADPGNLAFTKPMRSVTVLTREDIEDSSATDLDELLAGVSGVSVRRRGVPGVQADIGIRGSNFKETRIMIDGVPIQNAQSAHLNSNLPIPLSAIQRIEVVKGPGAIQYGGSGTGGIINIITRRADHPQAGVAISGGSHASRQVTANAGIGSARFSSLLTANISHSDSARHDQPTDANIQQFLYTGDVTLDALQVRGGLASSRKDFGAWGFYSDTFPNEHETTHSRMAWLGAALPVGKWNFHTRGYWMRDKDRFLTLIGSQGFLNHHKVDSAGMDADIRHNDAWGTTVVGARFRHEKLHSNALGQRQRSKVTTWLFRHQKITDQLSAELGVNRVDYQHDKTYWLPSAALAWQFNKQWRAYASWARSARVPTYTELYLDTPANVGNTALGPETSSYEELGVNGFFHHQQLKLSVFRRNTSNFIDFTRQPGMSAFHAQNLHHFRAVGGDIDWRWYPQWRWLDEVRLGYSRMHTRISSGAAKNSTHIPWQTFRAGLRVPLQHHLHFSLDARRPSYHGESSATLIGMRLQWRHRHIHAWLGAQNLLDKSIVEAGFAPIAGRWITVGLGYEF